jgi:hypothetical protein
MQPQYSTLALPDTSSNTTRVPRCHRTPSSMAKAITVNALAMILAWHTSLAMALGRLVLRTWPHFRRV